MAPDPIFVSVRGLCCRTLDFVFPFWIVINSLLISLFHIRLMTHGDWSADDAYSSMVPHHTVAFVGGPCCPT
jgi:hypothetical protein